MIEKGEIAIDCTHLVKRRCGGFESYLFGLLDGLSQIEHPKISIYVLSKQKKYFLSYENVFKIHDVNVNNSFSRVFWQNFIFPFISFRYAAILFPANFRPLVLFRPSVTVIHDLQYIYHPKNWGALKLLYRKFFIPISILLSKKVITISNTVNTEIKNLLPSSVNKIVVIYNPIRLSINDNTNVGINIKEVSALNGIKNYILVPSSLEPNKNINELLEAIKEIGESVEIPYFIFTGHYEIEEFKEIYTINKKIIVLGYVENSLLQQLFRECKAIILPSYYEGFGMPYIEALVFKKSIIVSDIPIARELLGDFPCYISKPFTRSEIRKSIFKYLNNDKESNNFQKSTHEILEMFKPEIVAFKYLECMLSL